MALVVVDMTNSSLDPIIPRMEYRDEEERPRVSLLTGEVNGKEAYLTLPWIVEELPQGVVITSLEATQKKGKYFKFWRIGWVQPWRRDKGKYIDLLLFMGRDDVRMEFSRQDGRGYAHVGYHVCGPENMTFGVRIDPGTILKVESMRGGETCYFAVGRDEDGKLTFSRPSAVEAETLGIKWCQDLPVFRRAKK